MTDQTNDNRLEAAIKTVRELGRDSALGKDSLPKLAFHVVKLAAEGVIDLEKKYSEPTADGTGTRQYDDAEFLFSEYAKAEGKKAVHERSTGGLKANVSKLRQLVAMGVMTTCDPQQTLEDTAAIRARMMQDGHKVKPAYAAYVDIARRQQESDSQLTAEEIEAVVKKPERASPEVEKILRGVMKKLEDLLAGENGACDRSDLVEGAFNNVRDRLAEITGEAKQAELAENLQMLSADKMAALLKSIGYQQQSH